MPVVRYELRNVRDEVISVHGPLFLRTVDGLGMPDVEHLVQRQAQAHGDYFIDYRLRNRSVVLGFDIVAGCPAAVWDARDAVIKLMAELSTGFRLRTYLPNGQRRQVDLRFAEGLTIPWSANESSLHQGMACTCIAYDNPTLYDPTMVDLVYALGGDAGDWAFPLGFPEGFGSGVAVIPSSITYPGTWRTFPIITISGPATDITLTNNTTGEVIDFADAYTILAGEHVVIDLTPGMKTVTHSVDGNIIDQISTSSDLATWHFAPHPEAPGGVNDITIDVSGVGAGTWLRIQYYTRYIGI